MKADNNWRCGYASHSTANLPLPAMAPLLAFAAANWQQVDAFHATALQYGGKSAGAPGRRDHYGPDFYAAYVRDPDGNKLTAVCRGFTRNDSSPT